MSMLISYLEENIIEDNKIIMISDIKPQIKVRVTETIQEIIQEYFQDRVYIEKSEDGDEEAVTNTIILNDSVPKILDKVRERRNILLKELIEIRGANSKAQVSEKIKDLLLLSDLLEEYLVLRQSKPNLVLVIL